MSIPNSKKIQRKQNEESNLIIQAASGHYYNMAEYLNYGCWAFCAISVVLSFHDDQTIIAVIIIIVDLLALLSGKLINKWTKNAGDLRKQFDDIVLFGKDERKETEKRRLKEISLKYSNRYKKQCLVQISNTGIDEPPGKKNWYTFSKDYDSLQAQIECFEQNKWWNDKILTYGSVIILFIHIIIVVIIVAALLITKPPLSGIANAIGVLFFRYIERMCQYIRYWKTTVKAETALDIVRENPSLYGVEKCQEYVNTYRHIPVFACSWVHRFKAKKLTTLYSAVSKKENY